MKKFYKSLISRQAGIYWQMYFGFLIIAGSVIPQGAASQITDGKLPEFLKSFLVLIKAHELYRSPLFLLSLAFFFVTLSFSTKKIVWPIFKTVFRPTVTPSKKALVNYDTNLEIEGTDFTNAKEIITKRKYKLVKEGSGLLHFEKFKWSKSSAMIAHVSLFLILVGVTYGLLTSFKSTVALVPSEKASLEYIQSKADLKGYWVNAKNDDWSVKVNKFWMDLHPNGAIKQYFSDLSIIDNATSKELYRKTIYVNDPLVYNKVYFYQASWGVSHLDVEIDGKKMNAVLQPLKNNQGHVSDKVKIGSNDYIFYLDQQNRSFVFDLNATPVAELIKNTPVTVEGSNIKLNEIALFTGLQVKKDLGIPFVYVGFVLLIISLIINFFSYNQLWVIEEEGRFYIIGKATRGIYLLEQEINQIADLIEVEKSNFKNKTHV